MLPKDIFDRHTHIGLDLDDTLAATAKHMLSELHDRGGTLDLLEEASPYWDIADRERYRWSLPVTTTTEVSPYSHSQERARS